MQDLAREAEDLRQRQAALRQGLRAALLIERLERGLGATLVARHPGGALPLEAQRYYDRLSALTRALPTDLALRRLARLAGEIKQGFRHILAVTRLVRGGPGRVDGGEDTPDVEGFLRGFAERSQAFAGLRVLLYRRGERTSGLVLEIPTGVLQQRLKTIAALEQHCRRKLAGEIRRLRADAYGLLCRPGLDPAAAEVLRAMHEELQALLEHLDGGGDLEAIAGRIQVIGLGGEPMGSADLAELLRAERVEEIPVEHIEVRAPPAAGAAPGGAPPPFRETLRLWLNTPLEVSWGDVRRWQERGGGGG